VGTPGRTQEIRSREGGKILIKATASQIFVASGVWIFRIAFHLQIKATVSTDFKYICGFKLNGQSHKIF